MSCPGTTCRCAYNSPLASSTWACSLRITAVAFAGMRAPVAIRTPSPSGSGAGALCPARMPSSPLPLSLLPRAQGPGPATTQPSMADVSNDGRSVSAARGSASTCPRARSRESRWVRGRRRARPARQEHGPHARRSPVRAGPERGPDRNSGRNRDRYRCRASGRGCDWGSGHRCARDCSQNSGED